jgi:hypothetical protein
MAFHIDWSCYFVEIKFSPNTLCVNNNIKLFLDSNDGIDISVVVEINVEGSLMSTYRRRTGFIYSEFMSSSAA